MSSQPSHETPLAPLATCLESMTEPEKLEPTTFLIPPTASQLQSGGGRERPRHWLPKVPGSGDAIKDYRTTRYRMFSQFATAEEWVAALLHLEMLQLVVMTMYASQDPAIHVTCIGAIRLMVNIAAIEAVPELIKPMKPSIFLDACQDPLQVP